MTAKAPVSGAFVHFKGRWSKAGATQVVELHVAVLGTGGRRGGFVAPRGLALLEIAGGLQAIDLAERVLQAVHELVEILLVEEDLVLLVAGRAVLVRVLLAFRDGEEQVL